MLMPYLSALQYALYVRVGCTGQMVATTVFKPFLANTGDNDSVAYFGKHSVEEVEVTTINCLSVNHC